MSQEAATPGRPKRVLVVDDVALNCRMLAQALEALGHQPTTADGGIEAVEMLSRLPFDLIFMDLHMPGMNGIEALRAVRATPGPNQHVPAVCVTADLISRPASHYLQLGFQAFLPKPISLVKLRAVISVEAPREGALSSTAPAGAGPAPTAPHCAPRSRDLLVVDRDSDAARLLASLVRESGWEVHCLEDAAAALELLKTREFGAMLLDPTDQLMRATSFLAAVKVLAGRGAPAVICVSRGSLRRPESHFVELGFAGSLSKPISPGHLAEQLRRVSGAQGRGANEREA